METENFLGYSGIRTMDRPASNLVTMINVLPWLHFWVLIKKSNFKDFHMEKAKACQNSCSTMKFVFMHWNVLQ
jgi:hypothetical protein